VSLSINHNIPSNWLTKTIRCNNKWNFWKLNLLNITKLKKSWPRGLISVIELFKNTKLKLKCLERKLKSAKNCSLWTMFNPSMIHHPSDIKRIGPQWRVVFRRIVINLTWHLSFRRGSLNTRGSNKSPRISWMKSNKSTRSYLKKLISKRANTRILFIF